MIASRTWPLRVAQKREYEVLLDIRNRWLASLALALTVFSLSGTAAADDNLYRAELVLFERIGATQDIAEQMQTRQPGQEEPAEQRLWVTDASGRVTSDLSLVSRNNLYLSSAADRLERSGRYHVLMATGWVQSFPPDYDGEPLKIALGDTVDAAGDKAVEGYINIDRIRYLHVTAVLNQWQPTPDDAAMTEAGAAPMDAVQSPEKDDNPYMAARSDDGTATDGALSAAPKPDRQLVTWLHQTRRMRSEEIHYLDSPTLGLLVYFQPIKGQAAGE